jgi:cation diffusion facilitator CzcD-associated flavoprotein CzcO
MQDYILAYSRPLGQLVDYGRQTPNCVDPICALIFRNIHAVFSDLCWPQETPSFPTAAQVGGYLATYAEKFLPSGVVNLGCRVTRVKRAANSRWVVAWSSNGSEEECEFDCLVIASGFFSEPYIPSIPGLDEFQGVAMHSSSYTSSDTFNNQHVAVIGGSLSSVEIVDDIAPYAASIHHVIPRPFWILPKLLPSPWTILEPSSYPLIWCYTGCQSRHHKTYRLKNDGGNERIS